MESLGRRERQKRERAANIHRAALEIAARQGLDKTTVDAISSSADVTTRTFFNYYASKEDAVLGFTRTVALFDDERTPAYDGSPFEQARSRVRSLLADGGPVAVERARLLRAVLRDSPSLAAHEFSHLTATGHDLRSWVEKLVRHAAPDVDEREVQVRTTAINQTIGAAYHIAAAAWSSDAETSRSMADYFDEAMARIAGLLDGGDDA